MHLLAVTATNDRSEIALYRGLVSAGHTVDLVCSPQWNGERPLVEGGVNVTRMSIRHRLDLRAVADVRRMLSEQSPDLVYAPRNSALSVSLLATRRRNIPVIGYRGTTGHLSRLDPASWLTYFHPRLSRIVCVSEAVRQYLLSKQIPETVAHTIYKGHRVEWYDHLPGLDRDAFNIPPDAFVLGFTGNIRPVKGVDVLLRSLRELPAELKIHLLLVGEVRDDRIKRMAAAPAIADRVHCTGYRTDAPALAGGCDAFVMPSVEREGLPRAVIEAMAQGVPPIVSGVGGMPELVEDGLCGLVVPPRNHQALAGAIRTLASDPGRRLAMGKAARQRIASDFSIAKTITKMTTLFESVL